MVFRAIGNVALQTAEKGGIAKNIIQPPYPCSLPLQCIEDAADVDHVESILDFTYDSILDMLQDDLPKLNASVADAKLNKPWKSVGYKDKAPGGDLVLESRPHVGAYNFARVHMTFRGVPPVTILHHMHSYTLETRQQYSDNISDYHILCWSPKLPQELCHDGPDNDKFHLPELAAMGIRDWHIEYNAYYAPPPVACRDMVYLVEKRYVPETNRFYIYGTSVDYTPAADSKSAGRKCVRGYVMFGWEFSVVGDSTKARYVSCMNPNGWTPAFLVSFFNSAIGKELTQSREMLYEMLRLNAKLNDSGEAETSRIKLCAPPTVTAAAPDVSSLLGSPLDNRCSGAPLSICVPGRAHSRGVDRGTTHTTNNAMCSPLSLAESDALRDDSFSFLSRGASTPRFGEPNNSSLSSTYPLHCEDARLCDVFADEELCQ